MFARRTAVLSAVGFLMFASGNAMAQEAAAQPAKVYTNWSLESTFKLRDNTPRADFRKPAEGRDDHARRGDERGDRRGDNARDDDHRRGRDDRRSRWHDRDEDRGGACRDTLETTMELDGRRVIARVRIYEECGRLRARVELTAAHCSSLPDIERVSLKVRGCETWYASLERLCNKGDEDTLVFVADAGPRASREDYDVDLKVYSACEVERATWRDVEVN